jgi:hypothetical protein
MEEGIRKKRMSTWRKVKGNKGEATLSRRESTLQSITCFYILELGQGCVGVDGKLNVIATSYATNPFLLRCLGLTT